MELLNGKDLYAKVKCFHPLPEIQIFQIFYQLVQGIFFLHSNGICHRDIKLDNILFIDNTHLKLLDFSLAEKFNKKKLNGSCGTPGFMAPEIFGKGNYDEKIDVFSLGVVFFAMFVDKLV